MSATKPRVVIALGGNALQRNGEVAAAAQKAVATQVGQTIAALSSDYEIIVAHGNGPQVGNILIHEETAATDSAPAMPLETAVAMSQGQIGYWLAQAIDNAFVEAPNDQNQLNTAALVTQVVVDEHDPAFANPTKPIGEFYTAEQAQTLESERSWTLREDAGRGYRRVVPSPRPIDIVEQQGIKTLVESGAIVIAAGGGGIPVIRANNGELHGVDAVIDKDLAAEVLAKIIAADIFVSVTAVPNVFINFGTPEQQALGQISKDELQTYLDAGHFAAGSMLPKVQAALQFADENRRSIITSPENLAAALKSQAGTIITA